MGTKTAMSKPFGEMQPYIITLEQVKSYLGIADTTYDAQLNIYIPVISDFLVGNYGYLNNSFLLTAAGEATIGSTDITLSVSDAKILNIGDVLLSTAYANNTVVSDIDYVTGIVTMDNVAISTVSEDMYFSIFPVAAKSTASQLIWFKIGTISTSGATSDMTDVKTKKYGPVSVTFEGAGGTGSISANGYPTKLLNALRQYKRPRFA